MDVDVFFEFFDVRWVMDQLWKESIYLQREELAIMLREPMAHLAELCPVSYTHLTLPTNREV